MSRTVWTFPSQLAGGAGMADRGLLRGSGILRRNLAAASEIAGRDMERLVREGPAEALREGETGSLAVLTVGASAAAELLGSGPPPDGMLGYSLGIYTAAAASGALRFEDALRIVSAIEREGARVFPRGEWAMAFVTGMKAASLESLIDGQAGGGEVALAILNTPAQLVLAGRREALARILEAARPRAMRCELLAIAKPYHSRWMAPVVERTRALLETVEVADPAHALLNPSGGGPLANAAAVRERLAAQLGERLDWVACVARLAAEGFDRWVELPPGATTTRMVRWIAREAEAVALDEDAGSARPAAGRGRAGGAP